MATAVICGFWVCVGKRPPTICARARRLRRRTPRSRFSISPFWISSDAKPTPRAGRTISSIASTICWRSRRKVLPPVSRWPLWLCARAKTKPPYRNTSGCAPPAPPIPRRAPPSSVIICGSAFSRWRATNGKRRAKKPIPRRCSNCCGRNRVGGGGGRRAGRRAKDCRRIARRRSGRRAVARIARRHRSRERRRRGRRRFVFRVLGARPPRAESVAVADKWARSAFAVDPAAVARELSGRIPPPDSPLSLAPYARLLGWLARAAAVGGDKQAARAAAARLDDLRDLDFESLALLAAAYDAIEAPDDAAASWRAALLRRPDSPRALRAPRRRARSARRRRRRRANPRPHHRPRAAARRQSRRAGRSAGVAWAGSIGRGGAALRQNGVRRAAGKARARAALISAFSRCF